jgi:hypothetical protein
MPSMASSTKTENVVLNVFCSRLQNDEWLVMLDPVWVPQYLLHCLDSDYVSGPVQLDLEDLDRTMAALGLQCTKRVATTGSVELTAVGEAAHTLATWLSTSFATAIRPISSPPGPT